MCGGAIESKEDINFKFDFFWLKAQGTGRRVKIKII
jgi:hypothetical protein